MDPRSEEGAPPDYVLVSVTSTIAGINRRRTRGLLGAPYSAAGQSRTWLPRFLLGFHPLWQNLEQRWVHIHSGYTLGALRALRSLRIVEDETWP